MIFLKKNLFYSSFLIVQLSLLKSLAKPTWEVDDGQHCAGEYITWLSGGKEACTYIHVIFTGIKAMEDTILGNKKLYNIFCYKFHIASWFSQNALFDFCRTLVTPANLWL